jgi:hypothetical protein
MPNRDQTGPIGAGPRTGRGMGICGGNGRSFGRRGGMRRRCWNAVSTGDAGLREELEALRMQVIALSQQLAGNKA